MRVREDEEMVLYLVKEIHRTSEDGVEQLVRGEPVCQLVYAGAERLKDPSMKPYMRHPSGAWFKLADAPYVEDIPRPIP